MRTLDRSLVAKELKSAQLYAADRGERVKVGVDVRGGIVTAKAVNTDVKHVHWLYDIYPSGRIVQLCTDADMPVRLV